MRTRRQRGEGRGVAEEVPEEENEEVKAEME